MVRIVVTKIEVDQKLSVVNDDDGVEIDNSCDYTKCLFNTLYGVSCDAKRRYVKFSMYLVGRVDNFIDNDVFNEYEQRSMEYLKCVKMCVYKRPGCAWCLFYHLTYFNINTKENFNLAN